MAGQAQLIKPSSTAVSYTHLDVYKRQALKQLTDGSQSLTDGLGELVKNDDTLNAGASQLNAGLAQLSGNNHTLNGGIAQISAGLAQLSDNNDTLNGGIGVQKCRYRLEEH